MNPVEIRSGGSPVVLGLPHSGTFLPGDILDRLNEQGRILTDTDWHVDRLYDGLLSDLTTVRATFHRYVIDANRDPAGESLYPGQNTTGLIPLTDFDNKPIWRDGVEPTEDDIGKRLRLFHAPYHAAIAKEIDRVKNQHGVVILYDCHSIRSHCPFLFKGRLPDFNIGDNDGTTCVPQITRAVTDLCRDADGYTHVVNGRFKGGWTTRHYGKPLDNVHAIQMELAQSTHLASEALPFSYDAAKAARLREHLKSILSALADLATDIRVSA